MLRGMTKEALGSAAELAVTVTVAGSELLPSVAVLVGVSEPSVAVGVTVLAVAVSSAEDVSLVVGVGSVVELDTAVAVRLAVDKVAITEERSEAGKVV